MRIIPGYLTHFNCSVSLELAASRGLSAGHASAVSKHAAYGLQGSQRTIKLSKKFLAQRVNLNDLLNYACCLYFVGTVRACLRNLVLSVLLGLSDE